MSDGVDDSDTTPAGPAASVSGDKQFKRSVTLSPQHNHTQQDLEFEVMNKFDTERDDKYGRGDQYDVNEM